MSTSFHPRNRFESFRRQGDRPRFDQLDHRAATGPGLQVHIDHGKLWRNVSGS